MGLEIETPLLDKIEGPDDMKVLSISELNQLARELRADLIEKISKTGGHLGAGLGVVELTVALHHVFNTPSDRLVWDVGHQSYPHKILTGRRNKMESIRSKNGISGFTSREESPYDPFGAGHSSTSISAALGMLVARDLLGKSNNIIAVIGDGAMSAGMAFEAMNNAGAMQKKLIVILNDNDMSISPAVGAMSAYLSRLLSSKPYLGIRQVMKNLASHFPDRFAKVARRAEEYTRGIVTGGTLFEELGFYYVGPVNGHKIEHLVPVLRNVKESKRNGPFLIHAVTKKGNGYLPAEESEDKFHGVSRFDVVSGTQSKSKTKLPTFTSVFSKTLIKIAEKDKTIVAVTAAMPDGTGLDKFKERFPSRSFDVGIAEQHAITFAAGLATEGFRPFAAIYSTFLQRAYDQVIHDIAIQKLPVRFAIDRAGFVGADGRTHHGSFDIAYLSNLPNFVVMAPADEAELVHMISTAALYDAGPISFRYPRGGGLGIDLPVEGIELDIGKGRILREGSSVAILSLGSRLHDCLKAADELEVHGLKVTVADARFAKPIDLDLLDLLCDNHDLLITVEEGVQGGFGSRVLGILSEQGRFDKGLAVRNLTMPDRFLDHSSAEQQLKDSGLDSEGILNKIISVIAQDGKKWSALA